MLLDTPLARLKLCAHSSSNRRHKAGLRQVDRAKRLRRPQSYVTCVETGQKIVDVIELPEWADAIGLDPREAIKRLAKVAKAK